VPVTGNTEFRFDWSFTQQSRRGVNRDGFALSPIRTVHGVTATCGCRTDDGRSRSDRGSIAPTAKGSLARSMGPCCSDAAQKRPRRRAIVPAAIGASLLTPG